MSFFDPNSTENEGRLRLHDPKHFSNYFRIKKYKGLEFPGISYVMGKDRRDGKIKPQAIRFDKRIWTEKKAEQWWKKHKRYFEKTWKKSDWKRVKKKAAYPKHPNRIIIKPNEYYKEGLREIDIYSHWIEHKAEVLEWCRNRNVMEVRLLDKGPIYIRRMDGALRLDEKNYEERITGRTVELHAEHKSKDRVAYIDIDPHDVDFNTCKKYTLKVYELLKKDKTFPKERLEIVFSGHKGFHVFIFHRDLLDIDKVRKHYRLYFDQAFEGDELVTTGIAKPKQIRIDTTLIKRRGTFKIPFSLDRRTGLQSLPLKPQQVAKFKKEQAKIRRAEE